MFLKPICTKIKQRKRLIKTCLIFSFCWIPFLSCVSASPLIASQEAVRNCRYLKNIESDSGYGKKSDWQGMAKHEALTKAEELGASHIVWEKIISVGAFNGIAVAKAYQCNL